MKLFEAKRIKEADNYTIENEPISSFLLMERAASKISDKIIIKYPKSCKIAIIVGSGNNGGDGLAVARQLSSNGFEVKCYDVNISENYSRNFIKNYQSLQSENIRLKKIEGTISFENFDLVVDAIFGSGLNRSVTGKVANIIEDINLSSADIIAIDIPSGLFSEDNTSNRGAVIEANYTYTFQFPKLSFLFPENEHFVGEFEVLDIGIHPDYIAQTETSYYYLQEKDIRFDLLKRSKFAHKGNFGHALLFTGSYNKMGASILSAKACINSGAGLVTTLVPKENAIVIPLSVPEIMTETYEESQIDYIDFSKYTVVGTGCGISTSLVSKEILHHILQNFQKPMVLDADAINIVASNQELIPLIPKNSILTPHLKELERLIGVSLNHYDRIHKTADFAKKHNLFVVIKGAFSVIVTPKQEFFFNTSGNPGMATAGSGDVLTGMITGLLAQNSNVLEILKLAVYAHGFAGDLAKSNKGESALTASDIIKHIHKALK